MSFKSLHQFHVTINREVKETVNRTENGKEIAETTTAIKPIQVQILLKEPSRSEKAQVSLFQSLMHNEAVNLGLMPRLTMIQKLSGNPISGDEDKSLIAMTARLQEIADDYMKLNRSGVAETDEQRQRKERLSTEWTVLQTKVIDINTAYQTVFAHTSEQYAQNKVLTWLTLFLTYVKVGPEKYEPMFPGVDFKTKEEKLGDLEDSGDQIYFAALEDLSTYWMYYYFGRAATPAQFAEIEADMKKRREVQRKLKEEAEAKAKEIEAAAVAPIDDLAEPPAGPLVTPVEVVA